MLQGVRNKKAAQEPEELVEAQIVERHNYHVPPAGHRIFAEGEDTTRIVSFALFRTVPVHYWNEKIGRWDPRGLSELLHTETKIQRKFLAVPLSVFPLPPLDK